jgi:serine/threonine protein phosphatase PrpC
MLEVVDAGYATITKRDKAFRYHGITLGEGVSSGQDAYLVNRLNNCYAVADGVGSSYNSDVAARAVCAAYDTAMSTHDIVRLPRNITQRDYVQQTLRQIHAAAIGALATTTFTGASVHPNNTLSYLHVGDSQLVLLRDGEVTRLTSEQVKESGYELLNYLGTQPEWADMGYARHSLELTVEANAFSQTNLEAEWGDVLLQEGDRFALMTDGILGSSQHDRMGDVLLKKYLHRRLGATACAQHILAESGEYKVDDSTIVIFDIG